jgi:hypothetical protein
MADIIVEGDPLLETQAAKRPSDQRPTAKGRGDEADVGIH